MKTLLLIGVLATATAFAEQPGTNSPGPGVDARGNAVFDPTFNVGKLVEEAVKRLDDLRDQAEKFQERINLLENKQLDDLRAAESRRVDEEAKMRADFVEAQGRQRAEFEDKVSTKEASRLDSIREVDRRAVSETAAQANLSIANLAKQTTDLATTLAKTVTDTATATEARFASFQADTNKRLGLLESGASERQGKSTLADPQIELLKAETERNTAARLASAGSSAGTLSLTNILIALGLLVIGGLTLYNARQSKQNGAMLKGGR